MVKTRPWLSFGEFWSHNSDLRATERCLGRAFQFGPFLGGLGSSSSSRRRPCHPPLDGYPWFNEDATMPADARFWNKIAPSYAKKPVADPEAFERKIAITIAQLPQAARVLDVGCGTGSLALRLAPHAAHVHGLDVSPAMVQIAKDKARAAPIENVSFQVGTLDAADFEPASLDGICAYSLLHLIEDRGALLERVHQLLKPGGFFISSTPCLGDAWIPYRPLLRAAHFLGKAPQVYTFRRQTLTDEIQRAGFVELSLPDVGAQPDIAFCVAKKPG